MRDLAQLTTSKVAPSIVVARVKTSSEPYKNFDDRNSARRGYPRESQRAA